MEEKTFQCDICEKAFIIHCGLSRHKRNHSGHEILQCDICENGFTVYSYLTRHKGSSSGEKLFQKYGQVEALSHLYFLQSGHFIK